MLFRNIIQYFHKKKAARLLQRQIAAWEMLLKYFQSIELNERTFTRADILRNDNKYNALVQSFDATINFVIQHNYKIDTLQKQFDEIIETHPIETILSNIDVYTVDQLRFFNEVALSIGDYTLPDSFLSKKEYLSYMRDIGELLNDYSKIIEQHSLIRDFDAISFSFGDRYIDSDEAEAILSPARTLIEKIKFFGSKYYTIPQLDEKIVDRHNEQYISNHLHDEVFNDVNGKSLDEEQRRAILCDSKSNLTVAGAGAGKTLTICGKVKWLLNTRKAREDEILLLSYSKASADDLATKIAGIRTGLTVKTFHSFGLEILNHSHGAKRAVEDQFMSYIKKFFDEILQNYNEFADTIFKFFSYYLYADNNNKKYRSEGEKFEELKTADYRTLKDRLQSFNKDARRLETLQKEFVKSYEELVIANFLFINGIAYEYERPYEIDTSTPDKRQYTPDFYLTDYKIYLEHYGINEDGKTPQYTKEEEKKYLEGIQWKRETHIKNNTVCIESYSYEFHNGQIFNNLTERLTENGVRLKPMSSVDIMNALHSIYIGQEFTSFFALVSTFVSLYKSQYSDETGFETLRKQSFISQYDRDRTNAFLDICQEIYKFYIRILRAENKIDFDDMILQAAEAINTTQAYHFKYIIVDEFQDISQSRMRFLKAIISHGNSKLFAVGDDWQAIYRFAGCDVNVFLHFEEYFADAKLNFITSTHRNSMELQAIVEPFITANPEQYVKHIQSKKHEKLPVRIIYHDHDRAMAFEQALKNLSKIDSEATVLVLGRNYHDIDPILYHDDIKLDKNGDLHCTRFPQMKITYKTVHQSKGLESDYVILISGENARNGFPNKMEDDCLLELLLGDKGRFEFAEERRLFYVALTRTRSIVYLLCDKQKPSVFIKEIEERVKIENPELIKSNDTNNALCPRCKTGKLILRNSNSGDLPFYGCSNFPYCRYTIKDVKAVSIDNHCPDCNDFLVIRHGRYGKFLACHNYPYCKYTRKLSELNMPENKIGF